MARIKQTRCVCGNPQSPDPNHDNDVIHCPACGTSHTTLLAAYESGYKSGYQEPVKIKVGGTKKPKEPKK